jgi:hypothetical protein
MPGALVFRMPALPSLYAKYSPDQPRVPAGNREGGQWTADGTGTPKRERGGEEEPRSARGEGADAQPRVAKQPGAERLGSRQAAERSNGDGVRDLLDWPEKIEAPRDQGGSNELSKEGGVEEARNRRGGSPPGPRTDNQQRDRPNNPPTRGGSVDLMNSRDAVQNHAVPLHTHGAPTNLRERMENEPTPRARSNRERDLSTFDDLESANRLVNRTLDANRTEIERWRANPGERNTLEYVQSGETGWILRRDVESGEDLLFRGNGVRVVIQRDPSYPRGWVIVTTYVISNWPPRGRQSP